MKTGPRMLVYYLPAAFVITTLAIGGQTVIAQEGLNHSDLPWPPVPRGIENVIDHSKPSEDTARERKRHERFRRLEEHSKSNPTVNSRLRENPTRLGVIDDTNDDKYKDRVRLQYFDRRKNETMEVIRDGDKVREIKTIPASEYQPEITDEEIAEAINLAREYFANAGIPWVLNLQGFGILAYKPQGKGFYDGRVIYVSFHQNNDSPPEFSAWVDLTRQTIIKTRRQ